MRQYYIGFSLEQPENFFPGNIQGVCHSFGALRAVTIVTQTSYGALALPPTTGIEHQKLLRVGRKVPEKFMHLENSSLHPPSPPPPPPTHTDKYFKIARYLVTALRIVEPYQGDVVSSNLKTRQIDIATAKTGYSKYFSNLTELVPSLHFAPKQQYFVCYLVPHVYTKKIGIFFREKAIQFCGSLFL